MVSFSVFSLFEVHMYGNKMKMQETISIFFAGRCLRDDLRTIWYDGNPIWYKPGIKKKAGNELSAYYHMTEFPALYLNYQLSLLHDA